MEVCRVSDDLFLPTVRRPQALPHYVTFRLSRRHTFLTNRKACGRNLSRNPP